MGARQALALGAARSYRRAYPVGFRLGGRAPQALYAMVVARELQGRADRPSRYSQPCFRPDEAPCRRDRLTDPGGGCRRPADRRRHRRAAAMVDGAYHLVYEQLKPGVRENDIVANVNQFLYQHGSDDVEAINAISGERCNPHPHNFTDRMLRPGDQAFFDILQSFMGYRTCYYRTFNVGRATPVQHDAYKKAREWLDNAMALIKPGTSTDKICSAFPKAGEFGFPDEMSAFGLQFAHGLGLALHERPIISRVVSMDHPTEIKEGMVFAIETYCPATDGYSAARIEEEVVVNNKGCTLISLFPAEDLPIAARY